MTFPLLAWAGQTPQNDGQASGFSERWSASSTLPLDVDGIHARIRADRELLNRRYQETTALMDVLKNKKGELREVVYLMDAISRVQERVGSERYLLAVYDCVTHVGAQLEAEQLIREHYAELTKLTALDVESAHVVRASKSKELAALAARVERNVQEIADRYRSLGQEQAQLLGNPQ
jgi:hypothetical protein